MSGIVIHNVQRLRLQAMTAGDLNTDGSGTLANYTDIPFVEDSLTMELNRPTESPGHARQRRDNHPTEVLTPKSWKLSFTINLGVPTSRAGDGVAIAQTPVGRLLEITMGGEKLATGDTISDAGPSSEEFDVATVARFAAGQIIGLVDSSSVMHLREVEQISSNNVKLKLKLPFTPSNGAVIYAAATYYLDNWNASNVQNAQFIVEGLGVSPNFEDSWVLLGGQCLTPPTIELPNNGIPRMTFTFEGPNWLHADEAAMTAVALAAATYTNVNEVLCADCEHLIPTVGTATLASATQLTTDLTITPNFYHLKHESSGGTNGVAGYVMCGEHPKVTAQFTHVYEDQTWFDNRDNKTAKAYFYQIGSSSTAGAILISMPNTQTKNVQFTSLNGIKGQTVDLVGRYDSDTTETTETAMGTSPFRIGIA